MALITSLIPGQSPPQVTMPHVSLDGSKNIRSLGPASSSGKILRAMIHTGMDVARLNFSHGSHDGYPA